MWVGGAGSWVIDIGLDRMYSHLYNEAKKVFFLNIWDSTNWSVLKVKWK